MSRIRIVYQNGERIAEYHNGECVFSAQPQEPARDAGYYVMPDIQPYQSQVDGSMIKSRSQHREHLREHRLLEIGDQVHHMKPYGDYTPKGIKQDLIRELQKHRERNPNG